MPSAVRFNGRRAFALLIALSLCFSLPVFAHKITPVSGVISLEPESFGLRTNSLTENTVWGFSSVPASFQFDSSDYVFSWNSLTAYTGFYSTVTSSDKVMSVQVVVGDGVGDCFVSFDAFIAKPYFRAVTSDDPTGFNLDFTFTGVLEMYVDGSCVYEKDLNDSIIPLIPAWEGAVSRYFELRITTTSDSVNVVDFDDASIVRQYFSVSVPGLTVNDESVAIQDISVSVKNIEQDVDQIKDSVSSIDTTVTNISEGVAKIEDTVTDMSEQLQDSDSNIWQAGATTIKNAVTELFVPPEDELKAQQEQLELKMADKLGPVMVSMEEGKRSIDAVVSMFDQSSGIYRFHFPGIVVNLPNIGEFVIVPEQDVVIWNEFIEVLQYAFACLIACLCYFSLLHLTEDMIYCLFSGVSYWGFVRSRHDK